MGRPLEETSIPPIHESSIWDLVSIYQVILEEKSFKNSDGQRMEGKQSLLFL